MTGLDKATVCVFLGAFVWGVGLAFIASQSPLIALGILLYTVGGAIYHSGEDHGEG